MIKCPICGAEVAPGTPFCPICGTTLRFTIRPVIAVLVLLALCWLALRFIPSPYCYIAAAPFAILALIPFAATAFGLYCSLQKWRLPRQV